jgi:hypothetical protein
MNKLIIAGFFAATGIAGIAATAPASAAPLGSVPYCSSDADINGNTAGIKQQLRGYGYDVQSVEEWNGCVRAYVANPNGAGEHMAYFDPDTLQLITTTGKPAEG